MLIYTHDVAAGRVARMQIIYSQSVRTCTAYIEIIEHVHNYINAHEGIPMDYNLTNKQKDALRALVKLGRGWREEFWIIWHTGGLSDIPDYDGDPPQISQGDLLALEKGGMLICDLHHSSAQVVLTAKSYGAVDSNFDIPTSHNALSILFLAADPTDASRLRLGEEFREIQEKLKLAKLRERFRLELPQLSIRPTDISQALLDAQPQIVHFSGHGTPSGALCFENQIGQTHLVQPDALAALFEQFANQVNCVLLNACYSEAQANAIAEHIEYVIGMKQAIGDEAAIAFTIGFYQAIGAGRSIEEAYKLGCVHIRLEGIPEHLTPVLIMKQQSKPKEQKPLLEAAVTSPAYNEPAILRSDQCFRTVFLPIPLFPGIGNSYLRDNYLEPPSGDVVLEGIKFRLEPNALIFDTSKQIRYYLPRPDGGKEVDLQLREPVDHVKAAYVLINSGNSKRIYASEKIGEIILLFKGAPPLVTELVLGENIREWCLGNPGDWIREKTNPSTQTAWTGMGKNGANAVIDCLKIPVYESMKNCILEKIIFAHRPTRTPSDELGVHFFVSAISLEIEQPVK